MQRLSRPLHRRSSPTPYPVPRALDQMSASAGIDEGGSRSSASISTIRRRVRLSSSSRSRDGGLASSRHASRRSCITRSSCGCGIVRSCGQQDLDAPIQPPCESRRPYPLPKYRPFHTTTKGATATQLPTGAGPRLVALSPLRRSQERHDAGKRDSDQAPGGAEEDVLRRAALARFQGRVEQPIAGVLAELLY